MTSSSARRRWLSGCDAIDTMPPRPLRASTLGLLATLLASACSTFYAGQPTPVIAGSAGGASRPELNTAPSPEPFRFNLPTPGPEPVSGWRPPLYSVPWAMSPHDHFYFARPIAADTVNWPLADYRYGGIFFAPEIVHTGVDIAASTGTPVLAAGPGQLVWTGWGLFSGVPGNEFDPYGLAVALRHDFGYQGQQLYTVYAHMSRVDGVLGQHVETGDQLGLVGDTGETTGPHLHFEVRLPENSFHHTYNPELWLAPPQGWGVLAGRVANSRGASIPDLDVYVRSEATREVRLVRTYGGDPTNADPYYNENLVMGDLPAGIYRVTFRLEDEDQQTWVEVQPGQVTYVAFRVGRGFDAALPSPTSLPFVPALPPATASP